MKALLNKTLLSCLNHVEIISYYRRVCVIWYVVTLHQTASYLTGSGEMPKIFKGVLEQTPHFKTREVVQDFWDVTSCRLVNSYVGQVVFKQP